MPLDPEAKKLLDQLQLVRGPNLTALSAPELRALYENLLPPGPKEPVAEVQDRRIPGPAGEIPVRIYTPEGDPPFAALVYFHGGGWVIGNLETHDGTCRTLTNAAGCVLVSVDYRLAPEHPFPAATEDCYAAPRWLAENAASLGVDPGRLAVGGDSAGGNLAAVVCQMARDRDGPALGFQLLIYPATDHTLDTPSHRENSDGYLLTRELMEWFWDHYVPDAAARGHPYVSPLRARNLAALPPALVITAEYDPLRDEGEAYAARLREAGGSAEYRCYDGMIHGFVSMGTMLTRGKQAIAEIGHTLRKALAPRGSS